MLFLTKIVRLLLFSKINNAKSCKLRSSLSRNSWLKLYFKSLSHYQAWS